MNSQPKIMASVLGHVSYVICIFNSLARVPGAHPPALFGFSKFGALPFVFAAAVSVTFSLRAFCNDLAGARVRLLPPWHRFPSPSSPSRHPSDGQLRASGIGTFVICTLLLSIHIAEGISSVSSGGAFIVFLSFVLSFRVF